MLILKIVTTVIIALVSLVMVWSVKGVPDKDTRYGITIFYVTYILSLICIWA